MSRGKSPKEKALKRARDRIHEAKTALGGTLFGPLLGKTKIVEHMTGDPSFACVDPGQAVVWVNPLARGGDLDPEAWAFLIGHQLLHLAMGHAPRRQQRDPLLWNVACEMAADALLLHLKIGRPPPDLVLDPALSALKEEEIYERLREAPRRDEELVTYAGARRTDIVTGGERGRFGVAPPDIDYEELFAEGIRRSVTDAVQRAADAFSDRPARPGVWAPGEAAQRWVMNELPLLGPLAAQLRIVADEKLCKILDIAVAAVDPYAGEIYLNPAVHLTPLELRFVYVHELLHAALLHRSRARGRDPHIWNLACDFVVNAWLIEAGIGTLPNIGALYDPRLAGKTAEEVYDILETDPRRRKGCRGFRGDLGDILFERGTRLVHRDDVMTVDDIIRRCLATGLSCPDRGRGLLPAGLVEEIRALFVPPVPWDVELGRWMDQHVPIVREARRSYARASRRQSSTPDIPRPARYVPHELLEACTFGVVLDTSGSMDRALLGRALGAIASYAEARDVPAVRLVLCDAQPYDQGFVLPTDLRGVFPVRGRGGTVLQPAVSWLCSRPDFPPTAPVMILTDGQCEERLIVPREHCFVMPRKSEWGAVSLRTAAPVFRVLKESHEED